MLRTPARTKERQRERRRRMLLGAAMAIGIPLLAAALWLGGQWLWRAAFTENDFFTIRRILVTTDGSLETALIEEYARAERGANLFAIQPEKMRESLLKVSAIRWAQVGRQLPDTLLIEVGERMPIARISGALAVDMEGHVLGPRSIRRGLPVISGLRDRALQPGAVIQDPAFTEAMRILEYASPVLQGPLRIEQMDVTEGSIFELHLANGTRVLLGTHNLREKLDRLPVMMQVAVERGLHFPVYDLTMERNYVGRGQETKKP